MANKKRLAIMDDEELELFRTSVYTILSLDNEHEAQQDYDSSTALLNQLWSCGLSHEDFKRFVRIVNDAADPNFRCPQ